MSKITDNIAELTKAASADSEKAFAGNHSASVRARKAFQEIKKLAQQGREEIRSSRAESEEAA